MKPIKQVSKTIKLTLTIAILCFSVFAEAQYSKPFGKLSWDDSILSSLEKLNEMGAESITLHVEQTTQIFNKKDLPKSKAALEKHLNSLFKKEYGITPQQASERLMFDNFTDSEGRVSKYYLKTINVSADNIVLSNIKCSIFLRFEARPEIAAMKIESAYKLSDKLFVSPMLMTVDLKSSADNVKDNYQNIRNAIAEKYYSDHQSKSQFLQFGAIDYPDVKGLRGIIKDSHISINYINEAPSELAKLYEKFKSELETKKNREKKDLSSGL